MTATLQPIPTAADTRITNPRDVRSYYDDIQRVIDTMNSRIDDYVKAEDFYCGNIREIFAQEWVEEILEGTQDAYLCNFSGRVVDEAFNRTAIQSVVITTQEQELAHPFANTTLDADPESDVNASSPSLATSPDPVSTARPPHNNASDQRLQSAWRRLWKSNDLDNFFPRWIKKALKYGDAYALVWPPSAPDQPPLTQVLDPKTTVAIYDEEYDDKLLFTARWFATSTGRKRMTLYYDNFLVKLISAPNQNGNEARHYVPYTDPEEQNPPVDEYSQDSQDQLARSLIPTNDYPTPLEVFEAVTATQISASATNINSSAGTLLKAPITAPGWPLAMPGGRQPIRHLKTDNDSCYGIPAHISAYGPQNAINKLIAVQMATVDEMGFPGRFALQKSTVIDQNAYDEGEDDELPPDVYTSSIESKPGTVNLLKDIDSLIQLAAADQDGFLKPMEQYVKFMSFVCATPMSFFDTLGQMPDDATQRENLGPLIMKCNAFKRVMRRPIESFVEDLFAAIDITDVVAHVQWAPSVRVDDQNGWNVITGKIANGVPWNVAMMEAGYTEAEIASWPRPSNGFTAQVDMALQIAQAAQALAAAANPTQPQAPALHDPNDPLAPAPANQPAAPQQTNTVITPQQAQELITMMITAFKSTPIDATSKLNVSYRG